MSQHPNARLRPRGRETLVSRVESGAGVADVARQMGVSRQTASKRLARARRGEPMSDRSGRPRRLARLTPPEVGGPRLRGALLDAAPAHRAGGRDGRAGALRSPYQPWTRLPLVAHDGATRAQDGSAARRSCASPGASRGRRPSRRGSHRRRPPRQCGSFASKGHACGPRRIHGKARAVDASPAGPDAAARGGAALAAAGGPERATRRCRQAPRNRRARATRRARDAGSLASWMVILSAQAPTRQDRRQTKNQVGARAHSLLAETIIAASGRYHRRSVLESTRLLTC